MPDCATALRVLSPVAVLLGGGDSLQTINTFELPDGCLCFVQESRRVYRLDRFSIAAAAGTVIIAPSAGPGRWLREAAPLPDILVEDSAARTVSIIDAGNVVLCTSDDPVAITFAPYATNPIPVRESVVFAQIGLGQLTLVAGPGVTLKTPSTLSSFGQNAQICALQIEQDVWLIGGLLEAAP